MIVGINHTAISTPDLERSLAFYCGLLGFEEVMKAGWPQGVDHLDELVGLGCGQATLTRPEADKPMVIEGALVNLDPTRRMPLTRHEQEHFDFLSRCVPLHR